MRGSYREFYRNGYSEVDRNNVISVVMIAMIIGSKICVKTNWKLNHCLLSTNALPESVIKHKVLSGISPIGNPFESLGYMWLWVIYFAFISSLTSDLPNLLFNLEYGKPLEWRYRILRIFILCFVISTEDIIVLLFFYLIIKDTEEKCNNAGKR